MSILPPNFLQRHGFEHIYLLSGFSDAVSLLDVLFYLVSFLCKCDKRCCLVHKDFLVIWLIKLEPCDTKIEVNIRGFVKVIRLSLLLYVRYGSYQPIYWTI